MPRKIQADKSDIRECSAEHKFSFLYVYGRSRAGLEPARILEEGSPPSRGALDQ